MLNLEAKVVAQCSVKDLEKKRSEMRMKLYQAYDYDKVDKKIEMFLNTIEKMLEQIISKDALFTI